MKLFLDRRVRGFRAFSYFAVLQQNWQSLRTWEVLVYSSRDRALNLHTAFTPRPNTHAHTQAQSSAPTKRNQMSPISVDCRRQMWHGIPFGEQVGCRFLFALRLVLSSRAVITRQLRRGGGIEGICCTFSCCDSLSGNISCVIERLSPRQLSTSSAYYTTDTLFLLCCFHRRDVEIWPFIAHYEKKFIHVLSIRLHNY